MSAELTRDVAFVFPLDLTAAQTQTCWRWAGTSRFVYNQTLALSQDRHKARQAEIAEHGRTDLKGLTSRNSLIPAFNSWKKQTQADPDTRDFSWLDDCSKFVREEAVVDAARALGNWFDSMARRRKGRKVGRPKFKKKNRATPSFRLRQDSSGRGIRLTDDGCGLRLPVFGEVRLAQSPKRIRRLLARGRFVISAVTVSFRQGRWQISICGKAATFHCDRQRHTKAGRARNTVPVGIDLGVRTQATIADANGQVLAEIPGVKALQTQLKKLRRANKALSRTKKGSAGRRKAVAKVARAHARIHHLRRDALHQITTELAQGHDLLVVEDLAVAAMLRSGRGARGVSDQTFGEFRRQLVYKADWYGSTVTVADRWFPSSKTCSGCGDVNADLGRGQIRWTCPGCGVVHDRDVNAAVNLARWRPLDEGVQQAA
ncbi:MAG: RNA-guided endonuclease TnpB family protein [Euzebya sp.]